MIELRAEEDGDLHIALADASGDKPGTVVAEIPAKAEWCDLRKIVFGWTEVQFPFRVRSGRRLKLSQPVVVTVIGKAFFDISHAPADHANRRTDLQGYAAWEIHPVMNLDVGAVADIRANLAPNEPFLRSEAPVSIRERKRPRQPSQ